MTSVEAAKKAEEAIDLPRPFETTLQWMSRPRIPHNVHVTPGFESLVHLDTIVIDNVFNKGYKHMVYNFLHGNKFTICNSTGYQCYSAIEEDNFFQKFCFRKQRNFNITISDDLNKPVVLIKRDVNCFAGNVHCALIGPICQQSLSVIHAPSKEVLGRVIQQGDIIGKLKYQVVNGQGAPIVSIEGPCLCCISNCFFCPCCSCDNEYDIKNLDGASIGKITKFHSELKNELVKSGHSLKIDVPAEMDVASKMLIIGASFLIDYMFYENIFAD